MVGKVTMRSVGPHGQDHAWQNLFLAHGSDDAGRRVALDTAGTPASCHAREKTGVTSAGRTSETTSTGTMVSSTRRQISSSTNISTRLPMPRGTSPWHTEACATRSQTSADVTSWGWTKSVIQGGRQIDHRDEDPRILRLYQEELDQRGVSRTMPSQLSAPRTRQAW